MAVEQLIEKWAEVLDHEAYGKITDRHRRAVTAQILENQANTKNENAGILSETPTNATGAGVANWDPVLISLVRRTMPNLLAYDVAGVQPMNMPTGLIFAMRARYGAQNGTEALYNEADTDFSGTGTHAGSDPSAANGLFAGDGSAYTTGTAMATAAAEALGNTGAAFGEMALSIEKVTVTAKSRALKANYSIELAQDLKAVHGLEAETELSQILTTEILAEQNREIIRTIYGVSKIGAQNATAAGVFDLSTDTDGRWEVEKYKALLFQIEREANTIAKETRRGRGNVIICSSDVASALALAGVLNYAPALKTDLSVDDTGNTFAGVLNGRFKVFIDPFLPTHGANGELVMVGYKGTSAYDAGIFYCPYVALQTMKAVGPDDFQPRIGLKTRYGLVANPFAQGETAGLGALTANSNCYFRKFLVSSL